MCVLFIIVCHSGLDWSSCSTQVLGIACFYFSSSLPLLQASLIRLIHSYQLNHRRVEASPDPKQPVVTARSARTKPSCWPPQENKSLRPEALQDTWPSSPLWPFSVPSIPGFCLCVILASSPSPLWNAGHLRTCCCCCCEDKTHMQTHSWASHCER